MGIVFKAFGKSDNAEYCDDMMFVSAIVMLICYSIFSAFTGDFKFKTGNKSEKNRFIILAVGCGILTCLYNRLNIFLAGSIDAIIFFPFFNGGVVLLSALLSMWLCAEVLSKKQKIGILTGIIAICLIGIL